ncbi:unnamed protein product [Prunus armeniaca]
MLKLQRIRQGPSSRDDDTTNPAPDRLGNHALSPLLAEDRSALLGSLAERHPPPGILPPGSCLGAQLHLHAETAGPCGQGTRKS